MWVLDNFVGLLRTYIVGKSHRPSTLKIDFFHAAPRQSSPPSVNAACMLLFVKKSRNVLSHMDSSAGHHAAGSQPSQNRGSSLSFSNLTSRIRRLKSTTETRDDRCEYCVKIPLDPYNLMRIATQQPASWDLGKLSRIADSDCPFCKLVYSLFFEWRNSSMSSGMPRAPTNYERPANDPYEPVLKLWWRHTGSSRFPDAPPGFVLTSPAIPDFSPHWIAFVGDGDPFPVEDNVSYLRSTLPANLDVGRVSRWVSTCSESHPQCRIDNGGKSGFAEIFPGLSVLRLIDVSRGCLIECRDLRPYVALSYVWGAAAPLRLTNLNRATFLKPGALSNLSDSIPRTIGDAIILVRKLGLQFLWVDSLCLMQNNKEDLDSGIRVMDALYENAVLTIVAANGHDANAGLPGVNLGSRKISIIGQEVKCGVSLGICYDFDSCLGRTFYHTRGWT
jgi:Heterokaryon incompatibility protein (HET)